MGCWRCENLVAFTVATGAARRFLPLSEMAID
jgi:hypothetical protein